MRKLLTLLALTVCAVSLTAQSRNSDSSLVGHVVDKQSGDHIGYATISLKGTNVGSVVDGSGHFFMKDLPLGEFTVVVSSVGYKSSEQVVTFEKNGMLELNFELEPTAFVMNEIVVSSSRTETNRREAPTVVNIIGDMIIETTASSTLNETLNFQPGLRMETTCGNCGSNSLRINGLEGHYSQILIDSRPVFSALAQVYGLEMIPVSMVDRIEVIRGGGSALFGANAIGGVVNIITKEADRNTFSAQNQTSVIGIGNDGQAMEYVNTFSGSLVSEDQRTGAYIYGMTKDREGYDHNGDGFTEITTIDAETIGFRAYHKISPYSKLTAEYHHISEYRRGGDQLDRPDHEAEISERLSHSIHGGGLTYDYLAPNYKSNLSLYTSFQNVDRSSYFGGGGDLDAYGVTYDKTYVAGGQFSHNFDNFLFMPSQLSAGVEYNYNSLHDEALAYRESIIKQNVGVVGAYLQNEWKSDKLNLIVGARVDKNSLMDNVVVSPRATARYTPIEGLALRASYSSGYRAPQLYDEDLHIGAVGGEMQYFDVTSYGDLLPEYSHSSSVSANYFKTFGRVQTDFLVEGFYTRINNVFATRQKEDTGESSNIILERYNADGAVITGINAELRIGIPNVFDFQAGYTFQKSAYLEDVNWSNSDNLDAQNRMFRTPDNYGYFTASAPLYKGLNLSLFGTYTGSMLVEHVAGYIEEDCEFETPSFFDMGTQLSYKFKLSSGANLELNGGVKNIFNSYQNDFDEGADRDAGYIYGPSLPRTVFVGLKLNF